MQGPASSLASGFVVHTGGRQSAPQAHGAISGSGVSWHAHLGTDLFILGHCLLGAAERSARFAAAVDADDPGRVADWPGSYSAIVCRTDGITVYSDLAGQFPLYCSRRGDETLIGPEARALAVRHGRDEPDPVTAAARIACPAVLPMWAQRSPYTGVERIAGGTVLRITGSSVRWHQERPPLPVDGMTLAEGGALLRDALISAVRARCASGPVTSDLSGGLDSASVAFLAARYSSSPVTSVVYHHPLAPAGDLAEAIRCAELEPRIDLKMVRGSERTLPFAELGKALREGRPLAAAAGWPLEPSQGSLVPARSASRLSIAPEAGAGVHLTGEGGDAVLMAAPSYLADLARTRSWRRLTTHCAGYARLRYVSPARLAVRSARLGRTSPGRALRTLAAELERPARPTTPDWADLVGWWPPCGQAAMWLTSRMRRRLAGIASDPETARAVPEEATPAGLAAVTDLRNSGEAQGYLRSLGAHLGIQVHAPFLDSGVIRSALSVPAETRADPRRYKPLLCSAMTGLVPESVLDRRTKGDYAAEDYLGARAAVDILHALLRDSRLASLGVIEPAPVRAAVDRMASGIRVPLGALNTLLATEIWLRAAEEVRVGEPVTC